MELNKLLAFGLLLNISFFSFAQNTEKENSIEFSGINLPLSGGYKIQSDRFLEQDKLSLIKESNIEGWSTIESRILILSREKCAELCNEISTDDDSLKVLSECSYEGFKARSLSISLDGIDTLVGIIYIDEKALSITNNKSLFNRWTGMVCRTKE